MARELALNHRKSGGLTNTRQEPWNGPLPELIKKLYFNQFKTRTRYSSNAARFHDARSAPAEFISPLVFSPAVTYNFSAGGAHEE